MSEIAQFIDLDLSTKLKDREYRRLFFRAEASAEIARQLIELRKRRDLTQAQLAELAGTGQPAISRCERADYQNWTISTLRRITEALDGRLRVVIEAAEDVLPHYESTDAKRPESKAGSIELASYLDARGTAPLQSQSIEGTQRIISWSYPEASSAKEAALEDPRKRDTRLASLGVNV